MGLKQGDRSNAVRALQRHLADWSPTLGIKDDGIYGQHTTAAVKTYQMAAGLPDTGEADDTTLVHVYTNALRNVEAYKRTLARMGL